MFLYWYFLYQNLNEFLRFGISKLILWSYVIQMSCISRLPHSIIAGGIITEYPLGFVHEKAWFELQRKDMVKPGKRKRGMTLEPIWLDDDEAAGTRLSRSLNRADIEEDVWKTYNQKTVHHDREMIKDWQDSLENLLIFVRLLSPCLWYSSITH